MTELEWALRVLVLSAACLLTACAGPATRMCPVSPGRPAEPVYVVRHGWHAGPVLAASSTALAGWPLSTASRAAQVEIPAFALTVTELMGRVRHFAVQVQAEGGK